MSAPRFATRFVVFRAAMRLHYLIKTKDSARLDMQRAFRDLLSELVQWTGD